MFNVSRSPVREALIELVSEGLLESIPNRGVYVKRISAADIINIYELREVLEKYAIEKAIENMDEKSIFKLKKIKENMIDAFENGNFTQYYEMDTLLHNSFFEISKNDVAIDIIHTIYYKIQTFRTMSLMQEGRLEESLIEHIDIIDGLVEKDFEKAWQATSKNLMIGRNQIMSYFEKIDKK